MRPLKLVMSAFGPYADKVEINLGDFGTQGLYLITGDTGAGKTTIFDGIIFALYGEASGNQRGTDMLRSKYAAETTPTFVELDFQYQGKVYHIKRNPEYMRPSKKSNGGLVSEKADAELIFPDGRTPITSSKEVTKAVIELIGVDKKQFMQIAMLAQGDFLKLLLAGTNERIKIFQDIFHTKPYNQLQEKLKEEASSLKADYEYLYQEIKQYLQRFTCAENAPEKDALDKIKEMGEIISPEEILQLMQNVLVEEEKKMKQLDAKQIQINERLEKLNQQLGKEADEIRIQNELVEQEQILQQEQPLLAKYKEAYETSEKRTTERDNLVAAIEQAKEKLGEYAQLDELQKKQQTISSDLNEKNKKLAGAKVNQEKTVNLLNSKRKQLLNVAQAEVQQASLQNTETELNRQLKQLDLLDKQIKKCANIRLEGEKKIADYQEVWKLYKNERDNLTQMEKAFYDEQAGFLAEQLKPEKPCPVCGSLIHPNPAQKAPFAPTREELETKKIEIAEMEKNYQDYNRQASEKKAEYDTEVRQIKERALELLGVDDVKIIKSSLKEKEKELQNRLEQNTKFLSQVKNDLQTKQNLDREIPQLESNQEKNAQYIQQLAVDIASYQAELVGLANQLDNLSKRLKFDDKKTAEAYIRNLEQQRQNLEKLMEQAKNNYENCNRKIEAAKSAKNILLKQMQEREKIDYALLKEHKQQLSEYQDKLTDFRDKVNLQYHTNQESYQYFVNEKDNLLQKQEQLSWVKALANTANGMVSGKDKINLETYIQMNYFDKIINRANTRLMMMTAGQYELKRRQEALDGRNITGLELNVIDHYNGSERSVRSLSGGESFKASLSLALGLSDEIQSSAGGIQLDTLFVDEGFGSLDEESLNQAIQTLQQLTVGQKLVGIISHVAELKEKIDTQIVVSKDKTGGSSVKLVK